MILNHRPCRLWILVCLHLKQQVCKDFWNIWNCRMSQRWWRWWATMALIRIAIKTSWYSACCPLTFAYHEIRDCLWFAAETKTVGIHRRGEIWWFDDPGLKVWSITMKFAYRARFHAALIKLCAFEIWAIGNIAMTYDEALYSLPIILSIQLHCLQRITVQHDGVWRWHVYHHYSHAVI